MSYKVDNAIIMAAGASSRFVPLSYEKPKGLITVKGEVLLERQIHQLREAGIDEIVVVTGYMKEAFEYLKEKMGVIIVENKQYNVRNNNSSIYAAKDYLRNSYVCSADNYFTVNPFEKEVDDSYYAAVYADGETKEWCMETDPDGYINQVTVGGKNAWYMLGHTFWNKEFSDKFIEILLNEYDFPETAGMLWETIYMNHLDQLKMKIKKYDEDFIFEFDSLEELREFDTSYVENTGSQVLKDIAKTLKCSEADIVQLSVIKDEVGIQAVGFEFTCKDSRYTYYYESQQVEKLV